ncbi:MAG: hypothetical protein ABSH53_21780 [Holophaga sp.]|jgi:hypothetical protein
MNGSIRKRAILIAGLWAALLQAAPVSPQGLRLAAAYDAMDVEHHWLPGQRIDWRSGDPAVPAHLGKTHCSAFVAAACERLDIYILRPPEHGEVKLANAQAAWLAGEGADRGWRPVGSPREAQELANQGQVVVAVYASPNPERSGHIALVRPADKPEALLEEEGPQVVQAGAENAASASLKVGFRHHREAWASDKDFRVSFYVHAGPASGE